MFQSTHPCGVRPAAAIVYAVLEQTKWAGIVNAILAS